MMCAVLGWNKDYQITCFLLWGIQCLSVGEVLAIDKSGSTNEKIAKRLKKLAENENLVVVFNGNNN